MATYQAAGGCEKGQDTVSKSIETKERGAVARPAWKGKPGPATVQQTLFRLLDNWEKANNIQEALYCRVCVEAMLNLDEGTCALGDNGRVDTWAVAMSRYYRLVDKWDPDVELACFGGPSQGDKCGSCPANRACLFEHQKGQV